MNISPSQEQGQWLESPKSTHGNIFTRILRYIWQLNKFDALLHVAQSLHIMISVIFKDTGGKIKWFARQWNVGIWSWNSILKYIIKKIPWLLCFGITSGNFHCNITCLVASDFLTSLSLSLKKYNLKGQLFTIVHNILTRKDNPETNRKYG